MNSRELKMDDASLLRERDRQLAAKRASRARTAPRRKAGQDKKRLSKEERRAKVTAIRAAVNFRAYGRCEFCRAGNPEEWHHIIGGGLRRKRESVETTAMICRPCHRGWEASDESVLYAALHWAAWHNFSEARDAIRRRIEKVIEARASSVRRAEGGR